MTRPQVSDPHALAVSRLTPTQRAIYSRSLASPGGLPAPSARPATPTRKPVAPTRKPPAAPARPKALSTSAERAKVLATRPDLTAEQRAALDVPTMSAKAIEGVLKCIPIDDRAALAAVNARLGIPPVHEGVVREGNATKYYPTSGGAR